MNVAEEGERVGSCGAGRMNPDPFRNDEADATTRSLSQVVSVSGSGQVPLTEVGRVGGHEDSVTQYYGAECDWSEQRRKVGGGFRQGSARPRQSRLGRS